MVPGAHLEAVMCPGGHLDVAGLRVVGEVVCVYGAVGAELRKSHVQHVTITGHNSQGVVHALHAVKPTIKKTKPQ